MPKEEMFSFINFIPKEFLILIVICYAAGLFLKRIPNVPDWTIPLILLVITVSIAVFYIAIALEQGYTQLTYLNAVIYGLLSSAVAVFGNNIVKQVKKRE